MSKSKNLDLLKGIIEVNIHSKLGLLLPQIESKLQMFYGEMLKNQQNKIKAVSSTIKGY